MMHNLITDVDRASIAHKERTGRTYDRSRIDARLLETWLKHKDTG
jgi:hypothetical protein